MLQVLSKLVLSCALTLLIVLHPLFAQTKLSVFVSVLPHKMMLEQIVGDSPVQVHVMVTKGFDPAAYQPTPKQLGTLADADLYLSSGLPFEHHWLARFQAVNPEMQILDLRDAVMASSNKEKRSDDPHTWTDPLMLGQQAKVVSEALQNKLPEYATEVAQNYRKFSERLTILDQNVQQVLANSAASKFVVFHPAWGHFSDRYDWQQISVEQEGKVPNAQQLVLLIKQLKQLGIKQVIVQPQNHAIMAQTVASAIDAKLVTADPLAEDYFSNLLKFAKLISGTDEKHEQ